MPPSRSNTAVMRRKPGETSPIHGNFAASAATGVVSFQIPVPANSRNSKSARSRERR